MVTGARARPNLEPKGRAAVELPGDGIERIDADGLSVERGHASLHGIDARLVVRVGREPDDRDLGAEAANLDGRRDAVHDGHLFRVDEKQRREKREGKDLNVHEDEVELVVANLLEGLGTVVRGRDLNEEE